MQRSEPCVWITWHLRLETSSVFPDATMLLDLCQLLGLEPFSGQALFSGALFLPTCWLLPCTGEWADGPVPMCHHIVLG